MDRHELIPLEIPEAEGQSPWAAGTARLLQGRQKEAPVLILHIRFILGSAVKFQVTSRGHTTCSGHCRFLKPRHWVQAAIPSVTVNGSVCSHPAAGTGMKQCETPSRGRDFKKAAIICVSEWTISCYSVTPVLIQKPTLFFSYLGWNLFL